MDFRHTVRVAVAALFLWCVPGSAAVVSVNPQTTMASLSSDFSLSIAVSADLADLYSFQFDLSFDPTILQVVGITEGPLLRSGGVTSFLPGSINNSDGMVSSVAGVLQGAIAGVRGPGVLSAVQFRAVGPGTSPVSLLSTTLLTSQLDFIRSSTLNGVVISDVPEPGTAVFLGVGVCLLIYRKHRRGY